MPERKFSSDSYRYGFNGKEKDNSTGNDNYDYGARIYHSKIGRWFSPDNVQKPWLSLYQFAANNPTNFSDPGGNDEIHFHYITIKTNVSILRNRSDGTTYLETGTVSHTYKYLQVIKNNERDQFFVHRNGKGTPEKIQFYPTSSGNHSGATFSSWYLIPDTKDNDYVSLQKISEDFPGLKDAVLPLVYKSTGEKKNTSIKDENTAFWNSFFNNLDAKNKRDAEEAKVNSLMIGVISCAVAELALVRIASGGIWLSRSAAGIGEDAATINNLNRLSPKKGWFDVVVHGDKGSPGILFNVDGIPVNAEGLYKIMLENGYQQGTKIRLISCNAANGGASSVAQELSNITGAQVIAPSSRTAVSLESKLITEDGSKYKVFKPE